jgi:hypothetical protein
MTDQAVTGPTRDLRFNHQARYPMHVIAFFWPARMRERRRSEDRRLSVSGSRGSYNCAATATGAFPAPQLCGHPRKRERPRSKRLGTEANICGSFPGWGAHFRPAYTSPTRSEQGRSRNSGSSRRASRPVVCDVVRAYAERSASRRLTSAPLHRGLTSAARRGASVFTMPDVNRSKSVAVLQAQVRDADRPWCPTTRRCGAPPALEQE